VYSRKQQRRGVAVAQIIKRDGMSKIPCVRMSLVLAAGAMLSSAYTPLAAAAPCRLYVVDYARHSAPGAGPIAETIVSIRNPAAVGGAPMTLQVEWLDPTGAVIGISGPRAVPAQHTFEFATTPGGPIVFPFMVDVPPAGIVPFEGTARIVQTDATCVNANRVDANAQIVGKPESTELPEYIHVKIGRNSGSIGD
jgi:hypothetical protein